MAYTGLFAAALACVATHAFAADQAAQAVLAKVGGEPIYADEVERLVAAATRGLAVDESALPGLKARMLEELINRRLVLAYAARTGTGPTAAEIDAAAAELKAALDPQKAPPSEAELRRQAAWSLTWSRYLARYTTPERLQSHFEAHRRQFDGTELNVSQILLRATGGPAATSSLVEQAEQIRREIVSGKLTFADAARKYSAAPSGKEGGRVGWIGRRGPMVESFSRAAFALDVRQISPPISTQFGVHLIRCDEIRPGTRQWTDAREELQEALARELLEKTAQIERRYTSVEVK
jgi:parvulin-like peptidyl-prolyl isomerase